MRTRGQKQRPFERSRPIRHLIAAVIIIFGLVLLVLGNTRILQEAQLLGGSVGALLSNVGFAALVIATFQWIFDNIFREVFFRDIRGEVGAAESVRDAGIVDVCGDSRNIDYTDQMRRSQVVEVGVAFSDRIVKDYLQTIRGRGNLLLRVFFADASDPDLVAALAYMTRRSADHVVRSAAVLQDFLTEIERSGITVERIPIRSLSHYSFVRFDRQRTFLTLSTFSSRRAAVPALQVEPQSLLWQLVQDDIEAAEEGLNCQTNLDASSTPWWKSLAQLLSIKRLKPGDRRRGSPR